MRTIRRWLSYGKLVSLVSTFLIAVVILSGCDGRSAVAKEPPPISAITLEHLNSGEILVAVLDTGIDQHDEDLIDKVIAEVNLTDSATASDVHGHGTKVASIIAAAAPNAHLLNVKVADDTGLVWPSPLVEGILWAVEHGAHVINVSLFTTAPVPGLENAVNYAWSQGSVVVAATSNYGSNVPAYPAHYCNCLAIRVPSSGHDCADVVALEANCSMATAHIAGLAGTLFEVVTDDNSNGFVNDEVWQKITRD